MGLGHTALVSKYVYVRDSDLNLTPEIHLPKKDGAGGFFYETAVPTTDVKLFTSLKSG